MPRVFCNLKRVRLQRTTDPTIVHSHTDSYEFDGLRYYRMCEHLAKEGMSSAEVAGKHQFVSVSTGSLIFGYARHACPGRFFAGNEIKLILLKLLQAFGIQRGPKAFGGRLP